METIGGAGRCALHAGPSHPRRTPRPRHGGEAQGADPAPHVPDPDPGGHRRQDHRPRDRARLPQGRHRQGATAATPPASASSWRSRRKARSACARSARWTSRRKRSSRRSRSMCEAVRGSCQHRALRSPRYEASWRQGGLQVCRVRFGGDFPHGAMHHAGRKEGPRCPQT